MNKSTLIAGLVGAIVLFFLGMLWYGFSGIPGGHMTEAGIAADRGENMSMLFLILGHLVIGILMSMIYSKWARGTHNFGQGFQFGALIGALIGVGLGMIWYGTSDLMTSTGHIIDAIFNIVSIGITGGVIAILYSKLDD